MSYSIDFRKKILDCYLSQECTNEEIADRFKVSISTVKRIGRRFRETGKIEVYLNRGGRKIKISEENIEFLRQKIKEDPGLTLQEMQSLLLEKYELQVTVPTIHIALKKRNSVIRKKVIMPAREIAKM